MHVFKQIFYQTDSDKYSHYMKAYQSACLMIVITKVTSEYVFEGLHSDPLLFNVKSSKLPAKKLAFLPCFSF